MDRYHRQALLPEFGHAGQSRLAASRVLLVGCGALGTVIAEQLARAGVGWLRIVDRDVVELTNLQRQVLFDERDAAEGTPKAVAAVRRLTAINSSIEIEAVAADVHGDNVERLAGLDRGDRPADLMLDGTDNVETRFLLNDVAVKHDLPWIYGACVGMEGRVAAFGPPAGPCLRCVYPTPPGPGELPTCDTAGVFGPATAIVASLQASAALKLLSGAAESVPSELITVNLSRNRFRSISLLDAKRQDCSTCRQRVFEYLEGRHGGRTASLCGRNAVQVRPAQGVPIDLEALAQKLSTAGQVERTSHLVRCRLADAGHLNLTLFPDGRLIVQGTSSVEIARSIYARYVGA